MDALTFLRTRMAKGWGLALLVLLAFESTLSALTSRFGKGGWWLGDFDAVICGAWRVGQDQSPYVLPSACEGLEAAAYVYAPQIAQAFAPLVDLLGPWGLHWAYLPFALTSAGFLIWFAVFSPIPGMPLHLRLMGLMAIRGSPITTGNIGAILQAAIVLSLLQIQRWRWVFVAAVIVAGLVKPAMMTALVVLLFENRPWRQRLLTFACCLTLGLSATVLLLHTAGTLADDWRQLVGDVVLSEQPGRGLFLAFSTLGIREDTILAYGLYILYAALTVAAGLILVTWNTISDEERACLGLGVAQLINPRLFEYNFDFYLLYPGMIVAVMLSQQLSRRAFVWLSWIFVGGMAAEFVINLIGIKLLQPIPRGFLICCLILFGTTALTLQKRQNAIREWLRRPAMAMRSLVRKSLTERP